MTSEKPRRRLTSRMLRAAAWLALPAAMPIVWGAAVSPPQRGFEQNVGQYDDDVLFALDARVFYRQKVQLTVYSLLSVQFVDSNPSFTVEGMEPKGFPLNHYLGSDPQRWRENVPHFSTVRYAQLYTGIDAEWNTGSGRPMVRFVVAPGADPNQLLLRLQGDRELDWTVWENSIIVWSASFFRFDSLAAYQPRGSAKSPVAVRFVQVDESSFRPVVGTFDAALPLVIEFGEAHLPLLNPSALRSGYDGAAVLTGGPYFSDSHYYHGFLAKVSADGTPAFLSLFDGILPAWLIPSRDGSFTAAGTVRFQGVPPTTPGAPRSVRNGDRPDGWVGRFDSTGRLRAATFTGDAIDAFAVDAEGSVYFASAESVIRWVPGLAHFSFTTPISGVSFLSTNASGGLAFSAPHSMWQSSQPTTPGAFKSRYEGPWELYVGKLDRSSGTILMATYVPIIGRSFPFGSYSRSSAALAPDGSIWIASALRSHPELGDAHTLVAVSADGSQVFHSEALLAYPEISFDARGNVLLATSTYWSNLPTVAGAPRRAGCLPDWNLHLRTMTPRGALIDATYLPGSGQILSFEGPDRLFTTSPYTLSDLQRVDTSRPANPGIACMMHTASRQSLTVAAAGGLTTLVGSQLGPLEQATAALDGSGDLPLELAGVEVRINQVPVPLVSVQQGLVTFYIPEDTPRGSAAIEVVSRGALVASAKLSIREGFDFAFLTFEGHGRGLAAALNQDGTMNGPDNPSKWGSLVSILGTGPLPSSVAVHVSGIRNSYGAGASVTAEHAGPAPGRVPGVKRIDFRLPGFTDLPPGWVLVRALVGSSAQPPTVIFVTP